jgi:hypothetical protein
MQMHRDDGVEVDIQILRPRDWIEAMDFREGAEFEVDLPHTSAHGFARIVAISACPALAAGEGSLVIGKFETRNAKELVKVTMEDDSVITGTRIHPVWSIDRSAWVELGNLEVGETLLGADGPTNVQCLTFLAANQPVYNLEVFGEHVYRVGTSGVLCHNTGDGVCTIVLNPGAPTGDMATEGGLNLFKWNTDQALDAAGWRDGDYFLLLPNQGSVAANWAQNSSRLREVMRNRKPIFDSYVDNAGNLIPTRGFLNAERELLINRRWTFNPTTGAWHPPVAP